MNCRECCGVHEQDLEKSWISGGQKVNLRLPSYAMTKKQKGSLRQNLEQLKLDHFDQLIDELQIDQDEIISLILVEAKRQMTRVRNYGILRANTFALTDEESQSKTLEKALSIAVITRLISKIFNFLDGETLGVSKVNELDSPYYGHIPIPTPLDFQIDQLWMERMGQIRKKVMSELSDMIFHQKKNMKSNWYHIFLTTLVLLFNLEFIYQNQVEQQRRYKKSVSLVPLLLGTLLILTSLQNPKQEGMMDSWKQAAENIKWHFRMVCKGGIPLYMDWNRTPLEATGMDYRAREFLDTLKSRLNSRGKVSFV